MQEVYQYDTFIVSVDQEGTGHAVAFVAATPSVIKQLTDQCGGLPTVTQNGRTYIPLDWEVCPGWHWTNTGSNIKTREWSDFVGKVM